MARFVTMDHGAILCFTKTQKRVVAGEVITKPGKQIVFNKSEYHTDDPAEIKFIRNRPSFGKRIWEGIAPDDVVATGAHIPSIMCGRKKCDFIGHNKDEMRAHKKEAHSKPRKRSR